MLKIIDKYLNQITMYRLLVYGLTTLLIGSLVFSAFHKLTIPLTALLLSFAVIIICGYIAGYTVPIIFKATANKESSLITCLILCCILPPSTSVGTLSLVGLVAITAILSKYLISFHYKHLFNPVAIAALIFGASKLLSAIWWIGNPYMLPLVLIFGLLVVRKIRRFQLFISFLLASLATYLFVGIGHGEMAGPILSMALKSSPLIFLGTIMLTEPSTMPPRVAQQRIYGALVGCLYASQINLGFISATPEAALIVGNIYSYIVSPKYKYKLRLKSNKKISDNIYQYGFNGNDNIHFLPGQYLEWTLHEAKSDSRGNRRTFSIASAPGDDEVNIVLRMTDPSSAFKKDLFNLKIGDTILAGQLAGDFTMPSNPQQQLVFLAGGIGITPFLSMIKSLIKTNEKRDIVLMYMVSSEKEFCFQDIWQQAGRLGIKVIPILSNKEVPAGWKGGVGRLDQNKLSKLIPDYKLRKFYISGSPGFVDANKLILTSSGISRSAIITDHFAGY